jgi:hypothetical protein
VHALFICLGEEEKKKGEGGRTPRKCIASTKKKKKEAGIQIVPSMHRSAVRGTSRLNPTIFLYFFVTQSLFLFF